MRKIVLLAIVALLSFGSANAQKNGGRQRMTVEEQVSNLKKQLNLTDEQTEKITALYTDFQKKMQEGGEKSREQMRSERENLDNQVNKLLNDEQKAAYKKMQEQRRGGQGKGQGKGQGQGRGQRNN